MYTDLGIGSHTGGSVHVQPHLPEETADPALLQAGDINMPRRACVEVERSDVVAVDCARKLG